jgi:Fe-S-cluster containining protein
MTTRTLSFHANYRCHHSGACCTSNWPIPVEADRLGRIRAAMASGALRPPHAGAGETFIEVAGAPLDAPVLLATADERCVFYDAGARRCSVQRAMGHDALPLACRQFPRVSLRDPRGVSVTLSHYCPTAAALLDADGVATIVSDPAAFPSDGEYIGLDATTSLPPLLRPDMLMDWDSWWEWERLSVELLASCNNAALGLARLAAAVENARSWSPAEGTLLSRVRSAFDHAQAVTIVPGRWTDGDIVVRRQEIAAAIPAELQPTTDGVKRSTVSDGVVTRLLASHAFANWTAHLGRGLRTWLRSVEAPLALIQSGLDVRTVDLWLRHLVDPKRAAESWSEAELQGN